MAKKSRARASAKSKAVADILADIELIEEALSEAEQHAEDGADSASGGGVHGSTAGHGKGSASSAMERMANDASAHSQSRRGGSIQTVAQLLNTHNPHGWLRNAMNGNISGGTLTRIGETLSNSGFLQAGGALANFGAAAAPHIFLAHKALQFTMSTISQVETRRADAINQQRSMQAIEYEFVRRQQYLMTGDQLTSLRQTSSGIDTQMNRLLNTDSFFGAAVQTFLDPHAPERVSSQAAGAKNLMYYMREHPYLSQTKRDQMQLVNAKKNDQVLKTFEVTGAEVAGLTAATVLTVGMAVIPWAIYNPQAAKNLWARLWNAVGDPLKIYDSELTKRANEYVEKIEKDELARQRNVSDFWNNPATGPIHREQELERTRWQSAVHEDYINRFLQWNTA